MTAVARRKPATIAAARAGIAAAAFFLVAASGDDRMTACDKACLEQIGDSYLLAHLAHDPARAPFAARCRTAPSLRDKRNERACELRLGRRTGESLCSTKTASPDQT